MTTWMLAGMDAPEPEFLRWLMRISDVDHAWELWIVAFGIIAQATFFGRWVVQWIATERRGESHMPYLFWWLSLSGASLLLIYYTIRHEPVGVIGQLTGWIIYGRNLYLIHRKNRAAQPPME